MTREEFKTGFDILYNNTTSNQAPALEDIEIEYFLNEAQIQVLKNHLNPKGNKYTEGYDDTSKRQIDFSTLTQTDVYDIYPNSSDGTLINGWLLQTILSRPVEDNLEGYERKYVGNVKIDFDNILSIVNERIEVAYPKDLYLLFIDTIELGYSFATDVNNDNVVDISDVTASIALSLSGGLPDGIDLEMVTRAALYNQNTVYEKYQKTCRQIVEGSNISHKPLVVIPISMEEYDRKMSRPYKYPLKSQAWRVITNNNIEVVVGPNEVPYLYYIRYIRMPKKISLVEPEEEEPEVPEEIIPDNNEPQEPQDPQETEDLDEPQEPEQTILGNASTQQEDTICCELPESLHREVLQRAVELAKAAWLGDLNATIQMGQRSE